MSRANYYLCNACEQKAFYDANVTYLEGTTVAALCGNCSTTHAVAITPVNGELRESLAERLAECRRDEAIARGSDDRLPDDATLLAQASREVVELIPTIAAHVAKLLAVPVDGELRETLVETLRVQAVRGSYQMPYDTRPFETYARRLTDALMPVITAHVVDQEQALREEIIRDIEDLTAHARDERPSRAFIDGFEKAVALAAHVARGDE